MERELSWHELTKILEAHETFHNFEVLTAFCKRYYPGATRVSVQVMQEYDDNSYYYSFGPSEITVYRNEKVMTLADDDVSLLVLLAQSPSLKTFLEEAQPDNPVMWLTDVHDEEIYSLELCGIERGYDLEVDLTLAPSVPRRVYTKKEDENALPADDEGL